MKTLKSISYYLLSIFFLCLFGFPLVVTFLMSFKSQSEYMSGNFWGLPSQLYFGNYTKVFASHFLTYFRNSLVVSGLSVLLILLIASMASYAFAKLHFRLSGPLFLLFLAGMMIPVHTTIIPIYELTRKLHLTDTLPGLIGPYISFGLPIAIYITTSFFKDIPQSIHESAMIDGAGKLRIYRSIMMPLSVPALSTVGIFTFLTSWNEFIYALTLISSNENKTLPLGIREFYGTESVNIPGVLTAILVGSLPIILLYLLAQEKVISGLSAGAVKG